MFKQNSHFKLPPPPPLRGYYLLITSIKSSCLSGNRISETISPYDEEQDNIFKLLQYLIEEKKKKNNNLF